MKKEYTAKGQTCKVTFDLPPDVKAKSVSLCGDFNGWDPVKHPMRRMRGGGFSVTVALKTGTQYRFRYLLDGHHWENDWAADTYLPNKFGTDDSVVKV